MSKTIGNIGETAAIEYLLNHNFNILSKNYFSRYGEIDIIAQKDQYIIFVEVKTRKFCSMVKSYESITKNKKNKIIKTAVVYLTENKTNLQPRFDFVEIITNKFTNEVEFIDYFEDAF